MENKIKNKLPRKGDIRRQSQKGVIVFLAVVMVAILLSIGLAITVILMGQLRMIRNIGNSVVAFYAADTGIEKALLNREAPTEFNGLLEKSSNYEVTINPVCAETFCLRSVGTFRGVKRAIEVEY